VLQLLERDCSKTLSTSAVQRRLRRFERAGLIERQAAVLNAEALGEFVLALVLLTLERESTDEHAAVRRRLEESPAVQPCDGLADRHDYAVMLVAQGMRELHTLVSWSSTALSVLNGSSMVPN